MASPTQVGFGEKVQDSDTRLIKVVRILSRLNIGGPSVHAVLLTEGLNNQNYRSTLVTGRVGQSEGNMLFFAGQHGVTPLIVSQLGRDISWRNNDLFHVPQSTEAAPKCVSGWSSFAHFWDSVCCVLGLSGASQDPEGSLTPAYGGGR